MDVPLDGRDAARVVDDYLVQLTAGVGAARSVLGVGLLADHHPIEGSSDGRKRKEKD
jgi:hypothetical protein